ncbi:Hypothetical protein AKI40_1563 [Enterobacter sp. FY-07]|nr:Hypothetical protein AKI40_1563 [Enterobacter sp. FY-07]
MIANFSEELPQFRTSTNLLDMEVPIYDTWLKNVSESHSVAQVDADIYD